MKNLSLLLLLAALSIGALVWGFAGGNRGDGAGPAGGAAGISELAPADRASGAGPRRRAAEPDPPGDPERRDVPGAAPGRTVTVRGRCVDDDSRLPVAAVAVELVAMAEGAVEQAGQQKSEAGTTVANRVLARTGGDGEFTAQIELADRQTLRIRATADRRADLEGFLRPGPRSTLDLGELSMPLGARLAATVLDAGGARRADVRLRLHRGVTGRTPPIAPRHWIEFRSDLSGTFESRVALAHGKWNVTALDSVRLADPAQALTIPEHESLVQARFVVVFPDPGETISGTLHDEQGRPVPGVALQAMGGGPFPVGYGRTDEQGRFRIQRRTGNSAAARLEVSRTAGFEPLRTAEVPWGGTDVDLTLVRAGDLRLTVVAADDRSPVETYRTTWFAPNPQGGWYPGGRGRDGRHRGGTSVLAAVPSGKVRIVVIPGGATFAPCEPHEFVNTPGPSELTLAVPRRVDLPVQVVDGAGRPVAGTHLQLVRAEGDDPPRLDSYVIEHEQLARLTRARTQVTRLDAADSDGQGRVTLRWHPDGRPLAIMVLGPGHVPRLQPVTVGRVNPPITIRVDRGATLRGVVTPLEVLALLTSGGGPGARGPQASVALEFHGEGLSGMHRRRSAVLDDQGRFAITGLAGGPWDVAVHVARRVPGQTGRDQPCTRVDLGPAEDRQIEIDIGDLRPATLRGQVLVNGTPRGSAQVQLTREQEGTAGAARGRATIVTTDPGGNFAARGLQAGRYRVSILHRSKGGPGAVRLPATGAVELAAGAEVERVFHILSGSLRVRLVDAAGEPVAGRWLVVRGEAEATSTGARTGADGWIEIPAIYPGTYAVGVHPILDAGPLRAPGPAQWTRLGEVTVTAGDTATPVTVKLPAETGR